MNDLALCTFLDARLNEDETRARNTTTHEPTEEFTYRGRTVTIVGFRDNREEGRVLVLQDACAPQTFEVDETAATDLVPQMRRSDAGQRTLREVAAKRVMLTNFRTLLRSEDRLIDPTHQALAHMMKVGVLAPIASVYEEHPDFQPEWKVSLHQFESDARTHAFLRQQRMHALRAAEATRTPRLWMS